MTRDQMIDKLGELGVDTGVIDYTVSEEVLAEWIRSMLMHTDAKEEQFDETRNGRRLGRRRTATYREVRQLERFHDQHSLGLTKPVLIRGYESFKRGNFSATVNHYLARVQRAALAS